MILKYAIKYVCFTAIVLYATMTLNIISKLWKHYKRELDAYQITTFSELELKRYDIYQINMLQESILDKEATSVNPTSKGIKTNVRNGRRNLRQSKGRREDLVKSGDIGDEDMFSPVGKIAVFSAYYDNREGLGYPVVRILGVTSTGLGENLVCGFLESVKGPWILAEKYEMCENHGKSYGGYMFNCRIPAYMKTIPKKVFLHSLTSINGQTNLNISTAVPLDVKPIKLQQAARTKGTNADKGDMYKMKHETKHDPTANLNQSLGYMKVGVCVSPIYGKINLSNFIQFIELLKLQGVDNIIIYKMTVSKSVQILVDYYQSRGDITIVNWTLPSFIQNHKIWYNGQIIMIQDCLYRMMSSFDYVAFLDLDEAIIPQMDFRWSDMIQRLDFQSSRENPNQLIAGFSFKSAYFDPNSEEASSKKLSFLKAQQRNKVLSSHRTKVIVKPEVVIEMGIHHVSRKTDMLVRNKNVTVFDVDPEIGLIHHFRSCSTQMDPNMNCDNSVEDTSILKYETFLTKEYNNVLRYNMKYFKTVS